MAANACHRAMRSGNGNRLNGREGSHASRRKNDACRVIDYEADEMLMLSITLCPTRDTRALSCYN